MKNILQRLKNQNISVYVGIIIYFELGVLGIYLLNQYLCMNDAFWHIKTGEWIEKYGFIHKCYGSWELKGEVWIAHEWLFGWILYHVSKISMNGIIYLFDGVFLLTLFLATYQAGMWKQIEKPPICYWQIVLILQFAIYTLTVTARPQYIAAVFIALYIIILNKALRKGRLIYLLPCIAVLWVNIHGGTSLLSYLTILVYLVCNLFNWEIGNICFQKADKKWIYRCIGVLLLTVLALMLNPYGYEMILYPYTNMQDNFMTTMIAEWASPDAKNIGTLLFQTMPMLMGIIALVQYKGSIKAHDVAIFFMYIILYLRSGRFYPFLVVVQTSLITPYAFQLSNPLKLKKHSKRKTTLNTRLWNNISIILFAVLCIVFTGYIIVNSEYERIEGNKELPDELIELIENQKPVRLFNHYNAGGYLLYHDIEVFVDGRYEPYQKQGIMEDYMLLLQPSNMEEYHQTTDLIEEYDFDAFLILSGDVILASYLEESDSKYKLAYSDEDWYYYVCSYK